jgi:ABC-type sugar transport system ATPase subunit
VLDKTALNRSAKQALTDFGVDADPRRLAGDYSPATQRLATIAAALSEKARVLILDEPTAALTEQETERLFARVAALHAKGVSCIHITHRLDEVEQYASRVVVLRNGEVATRLDQARGHHGDMVRAMIGREPEEAPVRPSLPSGKSRLTIRSLTVWEGKASDSRARVQGIDFDVRPGEVLGIYGLVGSGRTEMARAIFGDWSGDVDGQMLVDGSPKRFRSPRDAVAHGTVMLPEDRKVSGVVAGQTVNYNMSASSTDSVARAGVIKRRAEARRNRGFIEGLDIRPARLDIPIETMSGGNQQKVLLARCLATNPSILILDEPTVGVDVGARFEIFKIIRQLAEQGLAVLLISSDLAEISAESDRIMVMYKGRIVREFRSGASRAELMAAATGVGIS